MHTAEVEAIAHLIEEDPLPTAAGARRRPVGDAVAADDDRPRVRPARQDRGQRAHEDMVAAVRLEVAGDEGDDLIARMQRGPGAARPDLGGGRGAHDIGVDAFMRDLDFVAQRGRKAAGLPFGGGDAQVGVVQRQRHGPVARAQQQRGTIVRLTGELGVEAGFGGGGGIEELGVHQQAAVGPYVADEQCLPPAGVAEDEIGREPLGPEPDQRVGDRHAAGSVGGQKTTDISTIVPFATLSIGDIDFGQSETVTVTPDAAANGTLSDPNAASDGSNVSNDVFTVSGGAAAVTSALRGLIFTPTFQQVSPGQSVATDFTIMVTNTAGASASDGKTSVIATATQNKPMIDGTVAGQTTTDVMSLHPFAGISITDGMSGQLETVTVTPSTAANGALSDPNAASDGATVNGGVYTVSGTPSAVTTALRGVIFTPTAPDDTRSIADDGTKRHRHRYDRRLDQRCHDDGRRDRGQRCPGHHRRGGRPEHE